MRALGLLEIYRVKTNDIKELYGSFGDDGNGVFALKSPIDGAELFVIASDGEGWDHVSVSREGRIPRWEEMSYVKDLFFRDHETAMQLHVPESDHVNFHSNCLHLWRPQDVEIPRPPSHFVGPK